jgi:hypothetical protein
MLLKIILTLKYLNLKLYNYLIIFLPRTEFTYDVGSWWLERYFSNQIFQPQYNAHTPANIENLKIKNKVYTNILKIKDEYLNQYENKIKQLGIDDNTLGIQIRGTDKMKNFPNCKLETIFSMIDESQKEKIFVATDDKKYLDSLLNRYGNRIIYDSSLQNQF